MEGGLRLSERCAHFSDEITIALKLLDCHSSSKVKGFPGFDKSAVVEHSEPTMKFCLLFFHSSG